MLTKKALGLMIGALLSGALIGGEAAAGQTLADFHSKMGGCASCHGTNAVTAASVPDDERALNAQCQTCHNSRPATALPTRSSSSPAATPGSSSTPISTPRPRWSAATTTSAC